MASARFPEQFVWGAASAAYQIEGAHDVDGRGPSVWDAFCRKPGAVRGAQNGDVACDHYHRYREDVGLMRQLGLRGYRFSISWSRVLPEGRGRLNDKGLAFYDALVDCLLEANIAPYVTLFHWDYPLALQEQGGWLNRDSIAWFVDYAALMAERLGDRVEHWMTFNEPQVHIDAGHRVGRHAPGATLGFDQVLRAAHHVLLAHGAAVPAMRNASKRAKIGWAPVAIPGLPATNAPADVEAARSWMFATREHVLRANTWWMDAAQFGKYPADALELYAADLDDIDVIEVSQAKADLDFFGVNIYDGFFVRAGAAGPELASLPVGYPISAFDWAITPEALYWGPKFLYERYGLPIVITENGCSCRDWIAADSGVHDAARVDFLSRHLIELGKAIADGIPIDGYFHWTIFDNFEWAHGYHHRFGLIHVDYETLTRTPKDSARWYADIIRSRGACLGAATSGAFVRN